ncbi:MAG: MFS transporter [Oscillospiraceae bacterium]|nr:MFS transporter [Oscillospiraceae bacterium]
MTLEKKKFEYKWVILVVCFFMVFVCLGFCTSTKSLYLAAITEYLEIPRSLFAINDSCRFIASAIINLFFGTLLYKYGVRKMTAVGFLALIGSTLIYAFATSIYVFYIGGVLLGIGVAFTTTTMASTVIRRWFDKDIGKYTGIVFAANGVGGALAGQILDRIINNENGYNLFGHQFQGYQTSYLLVAALLAVFGTVVVILLRVPKDSAIPSTPAKKKKAARGSTWVGIDYATAKKSSYFYITVLVVFLTGFALQGIYGIYKAHMTDIGMDKNYVTNIFSVFSLALTVSKILVGAIYDRYNLRWVMIICQTASVIAFVVLGTLTASTMGYIMAVVFAFMFAIALPLETLVVPLIANDLFGNKDYDKILGLLLAANYAGYALGSPFINIFSDIGYGYKPGLLILAGVMTVSLILMQFTINNAWKKKEQVIAAENG